MALKNKNNIKKGKIRLAVIITHAIQYQVPLYKEFTKHSNIDINVYYFCKWGSHEYYDPQLGKKMKWDVPMLDGYKYKFLLNLSPLDTPDKFFGLINPGIIKELVLNKYDAVIIHGYAIFSYLLAYLGAWISGTPILFRGEVVQRDNRSFMKSLIKDMFLKILFKNTGAFLSIISKSTDFYKHYGVPDNKIYYAPYSVDNDYFTIESQKWRDDKGRIKAELGYEKDQPLILFVGKLVERKRPFDLLDAFVGDGKLKTELKMFCNNEKLYNVRFTGFINQAELPKYYGISDIFVLPSTSDEVSPVVINEAMCCGLPVVVSDDIPSAGDYVKNGINGYIYTSGDVEELSQILKELLTNLSNNHIMGIASSNLIAKFGNEQTLNTISKAIESIY